MQPFVASNKFLLLCVVLVCLTALLVVALWGNQYAGYYITWILLLAFFFWQSRR
jgi:hypothetical protein